MLTNSSMPEIREAVMVLHEMSADEKTQEIARLREKAIRDELAALKFEKQRADREYNEKMREREEKMREREEKMREREEKILAQKRAENERERNEKLIEILKAMGKTEEEIEAMLNTSSNEDYQ